MSAPPPARKGTDGSTASDGGGGRSAKKAAPPKAGAPPRSPRAEEGGSPIGAAGGASGGTPARKGTGGSVASTASATAAAAPSLGPPPSPSLAATPARGAANGVAASASSTPAAGGGGAGAGTPGSAAGGGIARQASSRVTFDNHDPSARIALRTRPAYCLSVSGSLKGIRAAVSKKKKRFTEGDFDLDLTYITPKIIAMGFPSSGREGLYRNPMPEVQRFFETRHAGRYRVYNLCSERSYEASEFLGRVACFPFDDHNPSQLGLIPRFCADVDAWLRAHPDNVVAIHCKAGKGRTGMMIASYLLHCGFRSTAEAALRWFGMRRTANGKGVTIPSQMRYVAYYEQMLRHGAPRVLTYRVTHIRVRTVPNGENKECVPYFAMWCDAERIFDYRRAVRGDADVRGSDKEKKEDKEKDKGAVSPLRRYRKGEPYMDFDLTPFDVRARGNLKIQFYHEGQSSSSKLFHLWVHTGFITRNYLVFGKNVTDRANKDKKKQFSPNFTVEIFLHRVQGPAGAVGAVDAVAAAGLLGGVPGAAEGGAGGAGGAGGTPTHGRKVSGGIARGASGGAGSDAESSGGARRTSSADAGGSRTGASPARRMPSSKSSMRGMLAEIPPSPAAGGGAGDGGDEGGAGARRRPARQTSLDSGGDGGSLPS